MYVIAFVIRHRLLQEGICVEQNIPSISSINRIIRDKNLATSESDSSGTHEVWIDPGSSEYIYRFIDLSNRRIFMLDCALKTTRYCTFISVHLSSILLDAFCPSLLDSTILGCSSPSLLGWTLLDSFYPSLNLRKTPLDLINSEQSIFVNREYVW